MRFASDNADECQRHVSGPAAGSSRAKDDVNIAAALSKQTLLVTPKLQGIQREFVPHGWTDPAPENKEALTFVLPDFGTAKALLIDGANGELIGISGYDRSDSASILGGLPSCAVISISPSACACDGFAHGCAKVFSTTTMTLVPLHGASTMTTGCTNERVRAMEHAITMEHWTMQAMEHWTMEQTQPVGTCQECGNELLRGAIFCRKCGATVQRKVHAAPSTAEIHPQAATSPATQINRHGVLQAAPSIRDHKILPMPCQAESAPPCILGGTDGKGSTHSSSSSTLGQQGEDLQPNR